MFFSKSIRYCDSWRNTSVSQTNLTSRGVSSSTPLDDCQLCSLTANTIIRDRESLYGTGRNWRNLRLRWAWQCAKVSSLDPCRGGRHCSGLVNLSLRGMIFYSGSLDWQALGKQPSSKSISEISADKNFLIGTFFFSRTSPLRRTKDRLIATLAYQLANIDSWHPDLYYRGRDRTGSILYKNIQTQIKTLLIKPFQAVPTQIMLFPKPIVIDGLDECNDKLSTSSNPGCHLLVHQGKKKADNYFFHTALTYANTIYTYSGHYYSLSKTNYHGQLEHWYR